MVAYLYGVESLSVIHNPNVPLPRDDIKQFIVAHTHRRVDPPLVPPQGWPSIPKLNVIYNMANGDPAHEENPCAIHFDKRQDGNASACSVTTSASSSAGEASTRYVL